MTSCPDHEELRALVFGKIKATYGDSPFEEAVDALFTCYLRGSSASTAAGQILAAADRKMGWINWGEFYRLDYNNKSAALLVLETMGLNLFDALPIRDVARSTLPEDDLTH